MKTFITALLCMLCVPAFADQQTTVLSSPEILKRLQVSCLIDGSNDLSGKKQIIFTKVCGRIGDKLATKVLSTTLCN